MDYKMSSENQVENKMKLKKRPKKYPIFLEQVLPMFLINDKVKLIIRKNMLKILILILYLFEIEGHHFWLLNVIGH